MVDGNSTTPVTSTALAPSFLCRQLLPLVLCHGRFSVRER